MVERILGFFFLFLGVGIIVFALFSGYQVFTAKTAPPQIFSMLDQEDPKTSTGVEGKLQNLLQEQLKGFIPLDTVPKILNLSVWSVFLGLLMFGGGQISGIGVKLLKK